MDSTIQAITHQYAVQISQYFNWSKNDLKNKRKMNEKLQYICDKICIWNDKYKYTSKVI